MPNDPFSSLSPSDSGLMESFDPLPGHTAGGESAPRRANREAFDAPPPAPVDADAPEESLRNVPLPEGFLKRMRRFVDDL